MALTAQVRRDLRTLLIALFRDNPKELRLLLDDLRVPQLDRARIAPGLSADDTVSQVIEEIEARDVALEVLFDALDTRFMGIRGQIRAWRAHLLPSRGVHTLILLHLEGADPHALRGVLRHHLGLGERVAADLVATAPVVVATDLELERAIMLGRTLEAHGALVSFQSPPEGPMLPEFWRAESGVVFARIPAMNDGSGFWLLRAPVTRAHYAKVMSVPPLGDPRMAMSGVSWDDADEFCRRASTASVRFRLPTEAEWEHAAWAGAPTRYPGGNHWPSVARAQGGHDVRPVCTREPNAWGLYDMAGNVWEWTSLPTRAEHPANFRVLKGGSFRSSPEHLVPSARKLAARETRSEEFGFRIVALHTCGSASGVT